MARILLVEDEPLLRKTLARVLRCAGHQIMQAKDGDEALARFSEARPELVITDLIMPGMDGFLTIQALLKLDSDVRILAMSGGGRLVRMNCLPMAKMLGAHRTLTKPFDRQELFAAVDSVLKPA